MNTVFNASCERMEELADGSVQTCVTSPPYFRLRNYHVDGQIGGEDRLDDYVERLVGVFREVRRVLRDDGTLWLNLGDSYAGSWGAQGRNGAMADRSVISARQIAAAMRTTNTGSLRDAGLKPKDLMGVPWRMALALQADGWWLRDDIIWSKPNPMPSSVDDRCTFAHEHIFMLAKSERYFADMDAVKTPLAASSIARLEQATFDRQQGGPKDYRNGVNPSNSMRGTIEHLKYRHDQARQTSQQSPNRVWDDPEALDRLAETGANLRNVWTIATVPYTDAHFATFPIELPSRCIRIGSKPGDLVLDPFMGSGTTAEAAEALGRRWVGYEINPEYCELIRERTRQVGLFQ